MCIQGVLESLHYAIPAGNCIEMCDSYLLWLLTGDAMGVFRVWQFLDSWGIINYQAGAGAADGADGLPLNVQPAGDHVSTMVMPAFASQCQWALLAAGCFAAAAGCCCSKLQSCLAQQSQVFCSTWQPEYPWTLNLQSISLPDKIIMT